MKPALKIVRRLESEATEPATTEYRRLRGFVALVGGRFGVARRLLDRNQGSARYLAMAEAHADGGVSRAQSLLAKRVKQKDATAGERFLAALAFYRVGESDRAHRLLAKAVAEAEALDEAFAPDPWEGFAQAVFDRLKDHMPESALRVAIAERLLAAGRGPAAETWVKDLTGDELGSAYRIRVRALQAVMPSEALRVATRWAKQDPGAAEPRIVQAELFLKKKDFGAARGVVQDLALDDGPMAVRAERVMAELALEAGRTEEGLEHARRAARMASDEADGAYWVARAMLAQEEPARAAEFAEVLLSRRPIRRDPFALLAEIRQAQGQTRKVSALRLRSEGLTRDRKKLEFERRRREKVLAAVRDADGGLGAASLRPLRADHPDLALPIDLALARTKRRGTARAARDQILAACAPHFARLLTRTTRWNAIAVDVAPYGKPQTVHIPLSAADPGRCPGRKIRAGGL